MRYSITPVFNAVNAKTRVFELGCSTQVQSLRAQLSAVNNLGQADAFNWGVKGASSTPTTLSCVISVNRARQTTFNLARAGIVGLIAPNFDVICSFNLASIALGVNKDYSRVNFSTLWRLMRIANTIAITSLMHEPLLLAWSDFMFAEGTQASAAEFSVVLPKRPIENKLPGKLTQLRAFSFIVFARRRRSLQRRSRRKVASMRVGRVLNVQPR